MRLALHINNIPFYNIYNALVFTYRAKYWKIYRFRIWPNFCPGLVAAYSAAYPSILYHSSPLQHTAILSCFSPIHSPHVSHLYNYFLLISVIIFFSHSDTVLPLLWLLPPVPCSIWLSSSVPKEDVGYCTCKNPDMPGSAFAEDTTSDPVPAAGRTLQPRPDTAQAYNVSISYLMGCESKDLPRSQYEFITPLLEHEGFKITYHNETETFTLDSESNSIPIKINQIKELSTAVQSYFRFKFSEIIKPPTTK